MARASKLLDRAVSWWSSGAAAAKFPWRLVRYRLLRGGWLGPYLRDWRRFTLREAGGEPIDVMVVVADHFEPASRYGPAAAAESVVRWCEQYKATVGRYLDADGRAPQHTWFYRAEYPNWQCLRALSDCCFEGFGEVEFHLHHGFDTQGSFLRKLHEGLDFFNTAGAMMTAEPAPQRRFAYVAGNWALDNGAADDCWSGCNTELIALREAGCYADFTFPAIGSPAQPRKTNSIYYAADGPEPKSYDQGVDVRVGGSPTGDLMIFQGPTVVDLWRGRIEWGALESYALPSPSRLKGWLRAHVHVRGRPEWVFVKLHCHGMQSEEAICGSPFGETLPAMAEAWNRPPFRLHFVTAREAYNIAKAAEAGCSGNAGRFRDFEVPPPANRRVRCSRPWKLLSCGAGRLVVQIDAGGPVTVELAGLPVQRVRGERLRRVAICSSDGRLKSIEVEGAAGARVTIAEREYAVPANQAVTYKWLLRQRPLDGDRKSHDEAMSVNAR